MIFLFKLKALGFFHTPLTCGKGRVIKLRMLTETFYMALLASVSLAWAAPLWWR